MTVIMTTNHIKKGSTDCKGRRILAYCRTCDYYVISGCLIRKHRRLGHAVEPEFRVERREVFSTLEAVTENEENTGKTRRSWRGVLNGAFDEDDRLLYKEPDNVFTGSVHWTNHFHCSKCGEGFFYPGPLEYHARHCRFRFHECYASMFTEAGLSRQQSQDLRVAHVTAESHQREREVCEELSRWTRRETGWDFPILHKRNWRIPEFNSHAFVLTVDGHLVSYLALREKLRADSKKAYRLAFPFGEDDHGAACDAGWALGEMFTARSERGRGYAHQLLKAALGNVAGNVNGIAWLAPLTDAGWKFVASLGLSEIMLADK